MQSAGLGGLRHNTVMIGWPYGWRHDADSSNYKVFLGKKYTVVRTYHNFKSTVNFDEYI